MKILIIQTAFLGDVILSLPLLEIIKNNNTETVIDYLVSEKFASVLENNPYISEIIKYDKKYSVGSIKNFYRIVKKVKSNKYDVVIGIQRYKRTSLIAKLSQAANRISFKNSEWSFLYTDTVDYLDAHEIRRNIELLKPLGMSIDDIIQPKLFPSKDDISAVNKIFTGLNIRNKNDYLCAAPGSVWFTKRFPAHKYIELFDKMCNTNIRILLIGNETDMKLNDYIISKSVNNNIYNYAGKLSILQSAELIKNSLLLITNDSAPLHIANAVGTKVLATFGSTVKDFGFYPYNKDDVVYEVEGLKCRPCTNHGRNECPIKTFECMERINVHDIFTEIKKSLDVFS